MQRLSALMVASALCLNACVHTPAMSTEDASVPMDANDVGMDAREASVPLPFTPTAATRAYCLNADDAVVEAQITTWLSQLSLEEKIATLHGVSIGLSGGTWRVSGNERLGIPGFHMLDGPRGLSKFTRKRGTSFPVAMMRGATWDPALEERVGAAIARELRSAGADVLLAPTMNVLRHPRWGRAQETYGEDTFHMGELARAFIRGVQSERVIAVAKHFAANSIEDTRHRVNVQLEERVLREVYLPHFQKAVDAHVGGVMSAYNQVNGLYCDMQPALLRDVLKREWGFSGFVVSDWVLGTHGDVESLRAGLDVEMPVNTHFRGLRAAVLNGDLDEHEIDDSVRRVVRAQLCMGLDQRPAGPENPALRETAETLALSRQVAERGIVLLKNATLQNESRPVLPINVTDLRNVVVVGRLADVPNTGDTGSSDVLSSEIVTALQGIRAALGTNVNVTHLPGTTLTSAQETIVQNADLVLMFTGLSHTEEGEDTLGAGDRESLDLMADEVALVHRLHALHPRVVVVLEGGGTITTRDWDNDVQALLFAFYPGGQGAYAIADVLFGTVNPSGKLPFSIPELESDLPVFDNVSAQVRYDLLHGYRYLDAHATPPRYPFGFGLSYTSFVLSAPTLSATTATATDTIEVTVDVRNAGMRAGRETIQLYVAPMGSSVERAPRDLRAFAKIELPALEHNLVTLRVPVRDLAYWDTTMHAFRVEPIAYDFLLGTNARDLIRVGTVRVQ